MTPEEYYENVLDILDCEIDALKDAYQQEDKVDRKTIYSTRILECLHAKKKLKSKKE